MENIKSIEHFAYPLPFNSELYEADLVPYRTNKELKDKIAYLFSHASFIHRQLFLDVSSLGDRRLINDMSRIAVGAMRHFMLYPQRFGHKVDNIHMQIIVKMWKQTFRHCKLNEIKLEQYHAAKMKLLTIENGFIEELIRTCNECDYIQHNDDMVKPLSDRGIDIKNTEYMYDINWKKCKPDIRARKGLGTMEGGKLFEELCRLE